MFFLGTNMQKSEDEKKSNRSFSSFEETYRMAELAKTDETELKTDKLTNYKSEPDKANNFQV